MLKVAIVGCGKIADAHAAEIQRVAGCEIVGVCDQEPLMARQLYDRFPIRNYYAGLPELLKEARPDVVHITTPPESHFKLAEACLLAGSHVYVEKPFTVYEHEARRLLEIAESRGLKVTVGHDDQFRNAARRMRTLIDEGYLGGGPVHMESYYCYELGLSGYAGALLGDKQHWVRRLPGKLLHNVISHGIARIAEYIQGDSPQIIAHGFVSPALRKFGETEIIDELRVIIRDEADNTAYFTFSSQMRPSLHEFRVYGRKNGLILDQDKETVIKLRGAAFKSYAEKVVPCGIFARQYLDNALTNVRSFLARDFHMKNGMKHLIESFYRSIAEGTPVPISSREILLTARIMEQIFDQLNNEKAPADWELQSVGKA